ncbi:hybrid signal transduction histidine kinase M [Tanacetum coccineum]
MAIDSIFLTWIFKPLSKTLQQRLVVENPTTTKEAWGILALIFNDNKRSRSIALKAELSSMKLGDLSIDAYFCKIEPVATILSSLGSPISNDDVVSISLDGLPDKYQHVSDIIIHRDPFPDLKTFCSMLTTAEMHLKSWAQHTYDSTLSTLMVLLANFGANARRSTPSTEKLGGRRFRKIVTPFKRFDLHSLHTAYSGSSDKYAPFTWRETEGSLNLYQRILRMQKQHMADAFILARLMIGVAVVFQLLHIDEVCNNVQYDCSQ